MLVLTAMVLISSAAASSSNTSYCYHNTLASNTSWPRFTKEPVPFEYGFEDKFKSIHCCAGGYRNIDWFKNDVPHPWSAGVSSFIQYPESAYQTLYTRRLQRSDAGNYTCRISNETHSEQHTILLEVLEKPPDAPKTMFISKDQWVGEGSRVRLYCEALVGRSYLADARSDLSWRKKYPNGTEGVLLGSQTEIKTKRDDVDEIIGAYLTFASVTAADYGTYVCAVRSNGVIYRNTVTLHYQSWLHETSSSVRCEGECIPWRGLAIGFGVAAVLLASLIVLHRRCTPRLLLAARIVHHRATNTQEYRARVMEKEFDVLVCWTAVDGDLVRGALLPTLSIKYKYRVYGVQLPTNPDTWYETLSGAAGRGRSLVCVLSPAQHSAVQLHVALRHLHALPTPPVVLLLQDIPRLKHECKDSTGSSLVSLLRRTRLLAWRHVHERAFWTALRLALPMPLPTNHLPTRNEDPIEIDDSKNLRSGSLTALV